MTTLTDFLLARITEDEAVARAAIRPGLQPAGFVDGERVREADDGRWSVGRYAMDAERVEGIGITIYDEGGHTEEQAQHIARHDPARVLAECEAKRRIVEAHRYAADGRHSCAHPEAAIGQWNYEDREPCATLAALALPYADHEDYREEWRP